MCHLRMHASLSKHNTRAQKTPQMQPIEEKNNDIGDDDDDDTFNKAAQPRTQR